MTVTVDALTELFEAVSLAASDTESELPVESSELDSAEVVTETSPSELSSSKVESTVSTRETSPAESASSTLNTASTLELSTALIAEIEIKQRNKQEQDARIAQLENDLAAANKALANCRKDLNAAQNNTTTKIVDNSKQYMNILVHFPVNKTAVGNDQRPNVERIAAYMKSHPEATCEIKGYASPEGPKDVNIKLANGRAASVKDMLVKKYGIAANRIKAEGQGISNMFDELSWNRVSICEIIVK